MTNITVYSTCPSHGGPPPSPRNSTGTLSATPTPAFASPASSSIWNASARWWISPEAHLVRLWLCTTLGSAHGCHRHRLDHWSRSLTPIFQSQRTRSYTGSRKSVFCARPRCIKSTWVVFYLYGVWIVVFLPKFDDEIGSERRVGIDADIAVVFALVEILYQAVDVCEIESCGQAEKCGIMCAV